MTLKERLLALLEWTDEEVERWLAPILNYTPGAAPEEAAA